MTVPSMIAGLDRDAIVGWCRGIDTGGYSTLAIGERIAYPNVELFTTLAAAAALTERVRVMSTVVVAPAHPAIELAKMAATIDVISAGRLDLGLGVGGRDEDYRCLERPFDHRHQRLDDQVDLLRRVWAGDAPGPDLHPVGPTPVQDGGPPLYSGALGPKAIARSARWATGIAGFLLDPLGEDAASGFRRIEQAWHDAGRTEAPRHVTSFWYALGDGAAETLHRYARGYLGIFGDGLATAMADSCSVHSEQALRDAIGRLDEAGCDEILLVPTTADPAHLDEVASAIG